MKRLYALLLFGVLLEGCVEVEDHLILQADGSGSVEIKTIRSASAAISLKQMAERLATLLPETAYPPMNIADGRALFPEPDFTFEVLTGKKAGQGPTLHLRVTFNDIEKLLASPYGKAHALSLTIAKEKLQLRALSGLHALANKEFWQQKATNERLTTPFDLAGLRAKGHYLGIRFAVTLPAQITSKQTTVSDKTAIWTLQGPVEPNYQEKKIGLGTVLTAQCSAQNIHFDLTSPVRLGLYTFERLLESGGASPSSFDAKQIQANARLLPVRLTLSRVFNLSGDWFYGKNRSRLLVALALPTEMAPQHWGKVTLEEVSDNLGNDLLLDQSYDAIMAMDYEQKEAKNKLSRSATHLFAVPFQSPPVAAKTLASIRGSVVLQYPGVRSILKLKEALTQKDIQKTKSTDALLREAFGFGRQKSTGIPLTHAVLAQAGIAITGSSTQSDGLTFFTFRGKGYERLQEAQLFDGQGQPWPGFFVKIEDQQPLLIVLGEPQGPFSLALLLDVGPTITLPFHATNIALSLP